MDVKAGLAVVIATLTFMPCGGFLMDTDCPAPPPCRCVSNGISCGSEGLTSVPIFRVTSARMTKTIAVFMHFNAISTIANGAFSNLGAFINGNDIKLYLSYNHLNDAGFSVGAFNGVTDAVVYLDISSNNLTTIPAAVGELHNLGRLDVTSNPIATVDDTVMQKLGHSLHELGISLQYTDLPNIACGLEHLTEIYVFGTTGYKIDAKMPCHKPLSAVKVLHFRYTPFKEFPDVFNLFPNLNDLLIARSMIRDMDICELPPNITLTTFSLSYSRLAWFPEMVNDFKSLRSCNLNGNMITSLGRHSIRNLPDLDTLLLVGNPLVFVSKCALLNLPKLRVVNLSGTYLTTIPSALRLLPNLAEANMAYNLVACDCHLHWTNQWDRRNDVLFHVKCHHLSNMKLNDFINTTITQCQ